MPTECPRPYNRVPALLFVAGTLFAPACVAVESQPRALLPVPRWTNTSMHLPPESTGSVREYTNELRRLAVPALEIGLILGVLFLIAATRTRRLVREYLFLQRREAYLDNRFRQRAQAAVRFTRRLYEAVLRIEAWCRQPGRRLRTGAPGMPEDDLSPAEFDARLREAAAAPVQRLRDVRIEDETEHADE